MRYRYAFFLLFAAMYIRGLLIAQRPFRQYQAAEYDDFRLPPDWNQKSERTRDRLHIPAIRRSGHRSRTGSQ
jgi:hypothetical protein